MFATRKAISPARVWFGAIFLVATTQGALAHAEESGAAAALFEEGLQAMQAFNYAQACPKLTESYWLDPRPGVLFTLAECEAKWGKIASAVAHYDDYRRLFESMPVGQKAVQRQRADMAEKQRAGLADKVPTLTLSLPKSAPPDAVVRRDNTLLGAPSLGVPLPIDPGTHIVVTELPSGKRVSREVEINVGDHLRIELDLPASTSPSEPPAARLAQKGARPLTLGLLGVGAVGFAMGGVTGGLALGTKPTINAHCVGTVCDLQGKDAADRAKALGWASTAGFAGGVASVGVAAALWFFGPNGREASQTGLLPSSWSVGGTTVTGISGAF